MEDKWWMTIILLILVVIVFKDSIIPHRDLTPSFQQGCLPHQKEIDGKCTNYCQQGFEVVNDNCVLLPLKANVNPLNEKLDILSSKLSLFFGSNNILVGYTILILMVLLLLNKVMENVR